MYSIFDVTDVPLDDIEPLAELELIPLCPFVFELPLVAECVVRCFSLSYQFAKFFSRRNIANSKNNFILLEPMKILSAFAPYKRFKPLAIAGIGK